MLIAVDGPAAAGKGALTEKLSMHYNLARLDTGLIYRAVGVKAEEIGDPSNTQIAVKAANSLSFPDLEQTSLRDETVGNLASIVAAIPEVRDILINFQRNFIANPPGSKIGVILDGRDIGTVVCPNARYKFFVTASQEVRAERRYKELQERGEKVIRSSVLKEIIDRDHRDQSRNVAPLKPAADAKIIDTSDLNIEEVFNVAVKYISSQN